MTRQPLCRWIILSDRAKIDEDGFLTLSRIFNMVEVGSLGKVAGPLTATTYWESGPPRGEVEFQLEFLWSKGKIEKTPAAKVGFGVTGRGYGIVDFPRFIYQHYGELEIRVISGSELQLATTLSVHAKV